MFFWFVFKNPTRADKITTLIRVFYKTQIHDILKIQNRCYAKHTNIIKYHETYTLRDIIYIFLYKCNQLFL